MADDKKKKDDDKEEKKPEVITKSETLRNIIIASPIIAAALHWLFGASMSYFFTTLMIAGIYTIQHFVGPSKWAKPVGNLCIAFLFGCAVWFTAGGWIMEGIEAQLPGLSNHIAMKKYGWWANRQLSNREVMPVGVRIIDKQLEKEEEAQLARVAELAKAGKAVEAAELIRERMDKKDEVTSTLNKKSGEVRTVETIELKKGDVKEISLRPGEKSPWMALRSMEGQVRYRIKATGSSLLAEYGDGDNVALENGLPPYKDRPVFRLVNTWDKQQVATVVVQ